MRYISIFYDVNKLSISIFLRSITQKANFAQKTYRGYLQPLLFYLYFCLKLIFYLKLNTKQKRKLITTVDKNEGA